MYPVPVATYILGPSAAGQTQFYSGVGADGGELCANVTCLGQRGVYTTSSGLQVAYLSGVGAGGGEETEGGLVRMEVFSFSLSPSIIVLRTHLSPVRNSSVVASYM